MIDLEEASPIKSQCNYFYTATFESRAEIIPRTKLYKITNVIKLRFNLTEVLLSAGTRPFPKTGRGSDSNRRAAPRRKRARERPARWRFPLVAPVHSARA